MTFGLGGGHLMAEYEMILITSVSELKRKGQKRKSERLSFREREKEQRRTRAEESWLRAFQFVQGSLIVEFEF